MSKGKRNPMARTILRRLWDFLVNTEHPIATNWSDKENGEFFVTFINKKNHAWNESCLALFKALDERSASTRNKYAGRKNYNVECKKRCHSNLQKLCSDNILKFLRKEEFQKSCFKYYYRFLVFEDMIKSYKQDKETLTMKSSKEKVIKNNEENILSRREASTDVNHSTEKGTVIATIHEGYLQPLWVIYEQTLEQSTVVGAASEACALHSVVLSQQSPGQGNVVGATFEGYVLPPGGASTYLRATPDPQSPIKSSMVGETREEHVFPSMVLPQQSSGQGNVVGATFEGYVLPPGEASTYLRATPDPQSPRKSSMVGETREEHDFPSMVLSQQSSGQGNVVGATFEGYVLPPGGASTDLRLSPKKNSLFETDGEGCFSSSILLSQQSPTQAFLVRTTDEGYILPPKEASTDLNVLYNDPKLQESNAMDIDDTCIQWSVISDGENVNPRNDESMSFFDVGGLKDNCFSEEVLKQNYLNTPDVYEFNSFLPEIEISMDLNNVVSGHCEESELVDQTIDKNILGSEPDMFQILDDDPFLVQFSLPSSK